MHAGKMPFPLMISSRDLGVSSSFLKIGEDFADTGPSVGEFVAFRRRELMTTWGTKRARLVLTPAAAPWCWVLAVAVLGTTACQDAGFLGIGRSKASREKTTISPRESDNAGARSADRGGLGSPATAGDPDRPGGENVPAGEEPISGSEQSPPYPLPPGVNTPGQPGGGSGAGGESVGPVTLPPGTGTGGSGGSGGTGGAGGQGSGNGGKPTGGVFLPPPWFVGGGTGPLVPGLPPTGNPSEGFPPWIGGGTGGQPPGNPGEGFPPPSRPPVTPLPQPGGGGGTGSVTCRPGEPCPPTSGGGGSQGGGTGSAVCDPKKGPCPSTKPPVDDPSENFPTEDHPTFGAGTGVVRCVPGKPCKPPTKPHGSGSGSLEYGSGAFVGAFTWIYEGANRLILPPPIWQDPPAFYPPMPPVVHYPPYPPPPGKTWLELTVIQTDHESWWKNCLWAAVDGNQDWTPVACNKDLAANGRKVFLLADAAPACNKVQLFVETYHNQGNVCNLRMQQGLPCEGPYAPQGKMDYSRNPAFPHESLFFRFYDRHGIKSPDPLIKPNEGWVLGDVNALSKAMSDYRADGRNKWLRVFFEDQPRENLDKVVAGSGQWKRLGIDFNDYVFDVKGINVQFDIQGSGSTCESR